ncbi:hypothetical protein KAX35_08370 [candidate division WOR-3 bacterium]|nr:hypothetical protein [candidate division WOR-3 bacterium]
MKIFDERPFKARNAEDIDLNEVLKLFVNPVYFNPFEYENSIIKGRMGTGKTMYLKANYAIYFYSIIPSLIADEAITLPVFIRLSDFQHLRKPNEIYSQVIIKIVEELSSIYIKLQDQETLAKLHNGVIALPISFNLKNERINEVNNELKKLNSEKYIEHIAKKLGFSAEVKPKFFDIASKFESETKIELINKRNPGITDVKKAYEILLSGTGGNIVLLIDEAGSLDKSFFRERNSDTVSFFEILMNQLRTTEFIRTKIAIYPHSYSDILTETRYGDFINLNEDVIDETGYKKYRKIAVSIIENYLKAADPEITSAEQIFDLNTINGKDCLEQIIYASEGNIRRFMQIIDVAMNVATEDDNFRGKITLEYAIEALKRHSLSIELMFTEVEKNFMNTLARVCRARNKYRFQFPYKSPVLSQYTSKSEEHNLLKILDSGSGRRGTTYAFDYAFCIHNDIPTHFIKETERIDKERSRHTGDWITGIAQISEEIVAHAQLPGKINGIIIFVKDEAGFIKGNNGIDYFFRRSDFIESDKSKAIIVNNRVRFFPAKYEDAKFALAIEML